MRFRVSAKAQQDIARISDHIRQDKPVGALSFARELRAKIRLLAQAPMSYRERTELKPELRAARHGGYLIFFRINGDIVEVLRVRHGARDHSAAFEN